MQLLFSNDFAYGNEKQNRIWRDQRKLVGGIASLEEELMDFPRNHPDAAQYLARETLLWTRDLATPGGNCRAAVLFKFYATSAVAHRAFDTAIYMRSRLDFMAEAIERISGMPILNTRRPERRGLWHTGRMQSTRSGTLAPWMRSCTETTAPWISMRMHRHRGWPG
jgi:hypothetical protein